MNARRWKRYPSYRDSGVSWLGEVPTHWAARRLKHVTEVLVSNVDKHMKDGEVEVRLCNYTDVYYNDKITHDLDFMVATASSAQIEKFTLRAEDVIITKDSETAEDIAVPAVVADHMPGVVCGYHLALLRPHKAKISGAFLNYMLRADPVADQFAIGAQGITRHGLTYQKINDVNLYLPPLPEQRAIAAFLDRETARIDALIAKKEALIRLLEEKRTALISHVVTKGLDPNVPMKDSGVPWLGEIPVHWEVRPLKATIRTGSTISYGIVQPGPPLNEGVPFVQTTNITGGRLVVDGLQLTTQEIAAKYPRTTLAHGDVILGIRASIGAAHVVPPTLAGANLSRGIARICPSTLLSPEFMVEYLRSESAQAYFTHVSHGSTFSEVSIANVRELPVALPPKSEQDEIVDAIRGRADSLIRAAALQTSSIGLLREHRQALITAAVTGQIDVRDEIPA